MKKILPVEEVTSFSRYGNPPLHEGDFESPPMLMLIGPYSAGKVNRNSSSSFERVASLHYVIMTRIA